MDIELITESTEDGWRPYPAWEFPQRRDMRNIIRRGCDICTFTDHEKGLTASVSFVDLGIMGIHTIIFADLRRGKIAAAESISRTSDASSGAEDSPSGDSYHTFSDSSMTMTLIKRSTGWRLLVSAPYLRLPSGEEGFKADVTLTSTPDAPCSASVSRLASCKGIAYSACSLPLRSSGTLFMGDTISSMSEGSLGGVRWLRTRGTLSGRASAAMIYGWDGVIPWGITLSEALPVQNAAIYGERAMKLGNVSFSNENGIWKITEERGRLLLTLPCPSMHQTKGGRKFLSGEATEIYGLWDGFMILDDGMKVMISGAAGSLAIAEGKS